MYVVKVKNKIKNNNNKNKKTFYDQQPKKTKTNHKERRKQEGALTWIIAIYILSTLFFSFFYSLKERSRYNSLVKVKITCRTWEHNLQKKFEGEKKGEKIW